jgi:amidase
VPGQDAVWITRFPGRHDGLRIGVKDLLDLRDTITTAGCRAVAADATVASEDAACLVHARRAVDAGTASFVGKTNLHELAFGADGINPAYGTPINPLDLTRIPGGSSSGSAVAVAIGEADVGIGTDTGGSIRIPAACCGVFGLKTSWGRLSTKGCWPLAPFLDTIGPIARSLADIVAGMELLEPGFADTVTTAIEAQAGRTLRLGRIVGLPVSIDATIDTSLTSALVASTNVGAVVVEDTEVPGWATAHVAGLTVLLGEAWTTNSGLLRDRPHLVGADTTARLQLGAAISDETLEEARQHRSILLRELTTIMQNQRLDALVLPTLPTPTPLLSDVTNTSLTALTRIANLAGAPALAVPIPTIDSHSHRAHLPTSLQLIGLPGSDAVLCAIARRILGL